MKKSNIKIKVTVFSVAVILVIISACVISCGGMVKYTDYSFDYFDTVTTVVGYADSENEFNSVCADIMAELEEYHKLYNIYDKYDGINNLCTLNEVSDGEHSVTQVDQKIIDLLLYAKEMYYVTDGKMNVAMGSVLSVWHKYRERGLSAPDEAELPSMEELAMASEHCNIDDVVIDTEKRTVYLADAEMTLDVGAVAKGYAVEQTARMLESRGISGYVLNVGGNVRTVGGTADGEKWTVGVENPDTDDSDLPYIATMELAGESLVTSGSYQRYYTVDGKRYHHIIDPETLLPGDRYRSVSVLCSDSGMGDALSTALFSMDHADGLKLVESLDGVEALWVTNDGEVLYSSSCKEYMAEK